MNFYYEFGQYVPAARVLVMTSQASSQADNGLLRFALSVVNLAIEKIYPTFGLGVCVDLLKRSKTCTLISIFGSLWDLYLDGILTNLTYMKFKLQILYWFIARLRGLPLWYFIFGRHAYCFNLHEVCSFKFYSRGAGADLPIQSNEAMANQWKGGLINHLYLLHVHGDLC